MPTFTVAIVDRRIIFGCAISTPFVDPPDRRGYQTLFDTGAQLTMISPRVVQEIALVPIGNTDIVPVSGQPIRTNSYRVRLDIPIVAGVSLPGGETRQETDFRGKELDVAELPYQPADYDVLLGMDFIIGAHITICGSSFILSS